MEATENLSRIRNGYDTFNQADIPGLIDLFDEDIVWHFPGSSRLGGDHVGRDATLAVLGAYGAAAGDTLKANVIDIMASEDHVAGVANDTASTGGKTLDVRSTVIFAMRAGKVTEAWHYIDDPAAFNHVLGLARTKPFAAAEHDPQEAAAMCFRTRA